MKVIKFAPGLIPVFKHQEHDQSTHGSWATGQTGDASTRELLLQQASQYETFEEFSNAVSLQGLRPRAWHIADVGFELDPNFKPMSRTGGTSDEPGLFVGDPETWQDYAAGRSTVIEYDVSNLSFTAKPLADTSADFFPDQSGNQGFFIRPSAFSRLREVRRMPIEEALSRAKRQQDAMPKSKAEAKQIWEESRSVKKHQDHDQSSHGNWAEGSQGTSTELSANEIADIISNSTTVNEMYQKVAERLGKSMKPQVADLSEEETNYYRGVTDVDAQAESLLNGKIPFGQFHTWGQGIYVSSEPTYAETYGELIRLKLDKSAKLVEGEIAWSKAFSLFDKESSLDMPTILDRITSGKMDNFSDSDIANVYWAAKGYDGFSVYATGRQEVVLFNSDKLTVNRADIGSAVKKHQEHDQSTHGNWALSENYPDLLTLGTFEEEFEYDPALMVYSERYGVDKDGKIVGVETFEHDGIDYYSQEGYKKINSYLRNPRGVEDEYSIKFLQQHIDGLDSLIDKAPDMFGDKTLFRVVDDFVLAKLTPGDTLRDKGFLSTTRIDITKDTDTRMALDLYESPDTVAVILPSPNKSGKGIAVDLYRTSVNDTSSVSDREKEVLLPRNTDLLFLGYRRGIGSEDKVAVFQRVDK
jgi:hypothetical protein